MNPYFSLDDKIYDVTEKYPELIEFLVAHGFTHMGNEQMRSTMGKTISLRMALQSKGFDVAALEKQMITVVEAGCREQSAGGRSGNGYDPEKLSLAGILPCPIRLQMLEKLEAWIAQQDQAVEYELPAASMGLDWLRTQIENSEDESQLADVYISAGFSLFFDKQVMGKYLNSGVFTDATGKTQLHSVFDNDEIDLKDPQGQYNIIGVVPAVFTVNTALLGERPLPESWADLLRPEFANTVSMPMQDLDLFNAVLLAIYHKYGREGVLKLGQSFMRSVHPAQMIKMGASRAPESTPLVTVMPYFFTQMIREQDPVRVVWPQDGAIISPILLMARTGSLSRAQSLIDFLSSKELGEVLSAQGKFPATHPEVDPGLLPGQKFMWPGWDFIYNQDIGALLTETEQIFRKGAGV